MVDTQICRRASTGECWNGAGFRTERRIRPDGSGEFQLKQAADAQTAPLLQQLKADPQNAALLAQVGNLYYDAKQYPAAIIYYEPSLKLQPSDTSVGTDLGTAYWYTGDADGAIAQFTKVLAIAPTKPATLFNLGIVKWQGKKDVQERSSLGRHLLDANPNYENREKVLQLVAQAQNR
jgi:tetratricopeptide (TPR) repeat protein